MNLPSKRRFLSILFALIIFGFIGTSIASYMFTSRMINKEVKESSLPLASELVHSELYILLEAPVATVSLMAKDTFVKEWVLSGEKNRKEIESYLAEVLKSKGVFTSFFVSEQSHQYYHPNGSIRTISKNNPENEWYFQAREMNKDYEIISSIDEMNENVVVLFINHRVIADDGRFMGIVGIGMSTNYLLSRMDSLYSQYNLHSYFINREGKVILSNNDFKISSNIRGDSQLAFHADQIINSNELNLQIDREGKKVFVRSRFMPELDWYLITEKLTDNRKEFLNTTLIGNISIALFITFGVLLISNVTINRYEKQLEDMATIDPLTGAYNRRAFEAIFDASAKMSHRNNETMAGLMIDLDHFKSVNDTFGHLTGDKVLKEVSHVIQKNIRDSDSLCRWGGEEFFVLLKGCDLTNAFELTEKVRLAVECMAISTKGQDLTVTVSIGVSFCGPSEGLLSFIGRADEAMYQAKEEGRNRLHISSHIHV